MIGKTVSYTVVAILLATATARQAGAQIERIDEFPEKVQRAYLETVVRITATDGTNRWRGSGVCIGYIKDEEMKDEKMAIILTAAHVVKDAKRMNFEVFTQADYPNPDRQYDNPEAKVWFDEKDDIAVITAKMWVPRWAYIRALPGNKGDVVISIGCGIGAPPVVQAGQIAGFDESGDYLIKRGAVGGRSGGPLIDRLGVVGILSRGRNGETLFVSLEKIHNILKRASIYDKLGAFYLSNTKMRK